MGPRTYGTSKSQQEIVSGNRIRERRIRAGSVSILISIFGNVESLPVELGKLDVNGEDAASALRMCNPVWILE